MNFHMGTATGMGGGPAHVGTNAGGVTLGYCILTLIVVTSLLGAHGAGFTFIGGGQAAPIHGGAAAGIIVGWGAATPPVYVPAHTMLPNARATSMKPRIPNFLTIPSSSFRRHSLYSEQTFFFVRS